MKWTKLITLSAIALLLTVGTASAQTNDMVREQSQSGKMMHKLGRGIVNVLTCWVEIPRCIASEWEKEDPVSGTVVGTIKGFGWGFTRFATGVFDTFTFPFPVPTDYASLLDPEFIVTDTWGAGIPGLTDFSSMEAELPASAPIYSKSNY